MTLLFTGTFCFKSKPSCTVHKSGMLLRKCFQWFHPIKVIASEDRSLYKYLIKDERV